ncbi:MAG: L-threonylcarbamoyladenylate synthase [Hyphomicrobiaceae bacterium]|nr:L-threonylcarbamoyladenylate synthase [Hyphomicrobiaceae bacterium]
MSVLPATSETIAAAGERLRAGGLVAFPTETVYGLGADATNGRAVAAIYTAKGRPRFNPLIVHVADLDSARALAVFCPRAERIAAAFWPGAVTLVLPRRTEATVADLVTAGLETIAVRVPAHRLALALLAATGRPLAAPSANRSGRISPTTAAHVASDLGERVDVILDGGPCAIGVESAIVDLSGDRPALLRPGGIAGGAIETVLGERLDRMVKVDPQRPVAPGQLESHYAPAARVRLQASVAFPGEGLLAFGSDEPAHGGPVVNLSPGGDLAEAAANLFGALRRLDATGVAGIAVVAIPSEGLGEAINDRLLRAAAPRPQ